MSRAHVASSFSSFHAPRRAAGLAAGLAALLQLGCAHGAPTAPRVVLAARITQSGSGRHEEVASASLRVPTDAPPAVAAPLPLEPPSLLVDGSSVDLDARYRGEASLAEVLDDALSGPLYDPSRAREARERARLSGLLPLVRVDVRRGSGWDLRMQQGVASETAVLANDDSWSVVGSVTLRLDRLVFARDEARLLDEERRLEDARTRLVQELVRLYAERRRLQIERDLRGRTDLPTEARIAELGALIEAIAPSGLARR